MSSREKSVADKHLKLLYPSVDSHRTTILVYIISQHRQVPIFLSNHWTIQKFMVTFSWKFIFLDSQLKVTMYFFHDHKYHHELNFNVKNGWLSSSAAGIDGKVTAVFIEYTIIGIWAPTR